MTAARPRTHATTGVPDVRPHRPAVSHSRQRMDYVSTRAPASSHKLVDQLHLVNAMQTRIPEDRRAGASVDHLRSQGLHLPQPLEGRGSTWGSGPLVKVTLQLDLAIRCCHSAPATPIGRLGRTPTIALTAQVFPASTIDGTLPSASSVIVHFQPGVTPESMEAPGHASTRVRITRVTSCWCSAAGM